MPPSPREGCSFVCEGEDSCDCKAGRGAHVCCPDLLGGDPLSILGVREPDAEVDLLGEPLNFERTEEGILLSLSPQDAFLFSCR